MSDASRDSNRIPSLIGSSNVGDRAPVDVYADPTTHRLLVNTTITGASGLVTEAYDSITATYPNTSTEVYTYKLGATTVATVTIIYSDAVTKLILTSVTRT
jgi:hypothetical protein